MHLKNMFGKEVMPVQNEILLGRSILDSPLLACLSVLDVLLVSKTNPSFLIVCLPAIS